MKLLSCQEAMSNFYKIRYLIVNTSENGIFSRKLTLRNRWRITDFLQQVQSWRTCFPSLQDILGQAGTLSGGSAKGTLIAGKHVKPAKCEQAYWTR